MNTQIFSSFSREKLKKVEKDIQEKHEDLNQEAKSQGAHFGRQNLPQKDEPINNYLRPVIEGYRVVFQEAKRAVEGISGEIETALDQLDDQIEQWQGKVKKALHEKSLLVKEFPKDKSNYPWKIFPLVLFGIIFMVGAETGFNGVAFQVLGQNLLISILMAIGVSVGIVLLFHFFKRSLAWGTTPLQKHLIILGWIVFYTALFYLLAELRQEYLAANGESHNIPKLMFVAVNWLMLLATAFILQWFPSRDAIQALMKRKPLERQIAIKENELKRLEQELSEKKTQKKILERDMLNMPKYENSTRALLSVMARKSVSDFLHENLQYRSDGNSSFGAFDTEDVLNTNLQIHEA